MKKILRGIVLKEVVAYAEPLVEFDPANIPLTE